MTGAECDRQHRIDRLVTAARQRTARAEQHAKKTIGRMLRDPQAITFRAVHRQSGLSLDYLCSNDTIRARIQHARDTHAGRAAPIPQPASADSSDGPVIRVVTRWSPASFKRPNASTDAKPTNYVASWLSLTFG